MLITDADLIAIRRANETSGTDAALAELRRRWVGLNDATAPWVLDMVLRMKVPKPGKRAAIWDPSDIR